MANLLGTTTIGGHQAIHVGNISSYAGITQASGDARYLQLSGGTVTGTTNIRNLYVGDSGSSWSDPGGWGTQLHVSNGPHSIIRVYARTEGIESILFSHNGGQSKVGSGTNHNFSIVRNFSDRMVFYSSYTYSEGYLQAADSLRAPIFYDSQDTNYYVDPNSTSNLAASYIGRVLINYDGTDTWFRMQSGNRMRITTTGGTDFIIPNTGEMSYNGNTVWTAGNDGSGSGLDSDLLDGQHGSYYQPASTAITTSNIGSQTVDTAYHAYYGIIRDTRAGQYTPNDYQDYRVSWEFTNQMPHDGNWLTVMTMQGWHNGYTAWQIMGPSTTTAYENWYLRSGINETWNEARTIIHSGNIGSQSVNYATSAGSAGSASTATTATNLGADYTADDWIRATADNNPVKFYGNSYQMTWRTDGASEAYSGIGGYPFVWTYGGSSASNRRMLMDTSGNLWTNTYGWLHDNFQAASSAINTGNISSQTVSVARQLLSPNGADRVAADAAMPSAGHSFIHTLALGPGNNDGHILGMSWASTTSVYGAQIFLDTDPNDIMAIRSRSSAGVWTDWKTVIHSGTIGSQSVNYASSAGNADTTDGLHVHGGRNNEANKIVRTDGNGYIQAGWINTDSGNMGYENRIARVQCSDDNYIRFQTLSEFKTSLGLSGKNVHSRRIDYTSDTNYHVGSFGQNGVSTEDVWHYGSGFFDVWAGGGSYPSGMSHIHGFNAVHYSVGPGGNGYGWQMASQYDRPGEYWARNISGGTFSSWRQFITSDNIGSQSVNYAASSGNSSTTSQTNFSDLSITGSAHKYLTINPGNGYEAMVRYIGGSGSSWYVGKRTSDQLIGTQSFHFYSEAAGATVGGINPSGDMLVTGSMRAPIFYDYNDTNYYLDPNASTSGYFAGVLKQNNGKFVRDSYYQTISGRADYYSGGGAGWYRVAEITLTGNCSGAVLYGTLYDHRYDGADAYQISVVARAECDFSSNNESHYINVGCTIIGSTTYVNYRNKIRVILVESSAGRRTYELQFYETNWNNDTWQLETTGWTIYTSAQATRDGVGGDRVNYISTQNADYQRANAATYSPVYYDSDDTGYYADFNSTGNAAIRVRGGTLHGPNTSWGAYLYVGTNGRVGSDATVAVTNGNLHLDSRDGYASYLNWYSGGNTYTGGNLGVGSDSASHRLHVHGTGYATSDFRAPIFYDSADTNYYLDLNSTSYLYHLILSGNSYFRPQSWIQFDGNYGIYWPGYYGLHLYPNNDGSYGSLQVKGTKNSWHGIHFDSGNTLMMNNNESGHHQQGNGWKWRWYQGTMYVSRSTYGGGTEYTVLDSGNYSTWAIARGGDTVSGIIYFLTNNGGRSGATDSARLQAYSTGGNSAFMSFHRGGYYAINFGLDDDNVMRMGGWSASSDLFQMDMSGNLTMKGDVIAFSDARVKTDIQTIKGALEKTLKLRGVTYNRIDTDDTAKKLGVIAQEVLEVIPEVVSLDNNGTYGVSYGNLVGLLIEAIKEQQQKIDDQQAQIDELKKSLGK